MKINLDGLVKEIEEANTPLAKDLKEITAISLKEPSCAKKKGNQC